MVGTDPAAKVRDNQLRRHAARVGLTLTKNRQTQLWYATRTTSRGALRIVSPAHGLDRDALADWLDAYREATP